MKKPVEKKSTPAPKKTKNAARAPGAPAKKAASPKPKSPGTKPKKTGVGTGGAKSFAAERKLLVSGLKMSIDVQVLHLQEAIKCLKAEKSRIK